MKHTPDKRTEQGESLFAPDERALNARAIDEYARENAPYEGLRTEAPMDPRAKRVAVLGVVFAAVFVISLFVPSNMVTYALGETAIGLPTPAELFEAVGDQAQSIFALLSLQNNIEGWMTLSAMVGVALAGAGLGLSGAVYQNVFKNALASPSTLGVMSGATLGVVLFYALSTGEGGDDIIPRLFGKALTEETVSNPIESIYMAWGHSLWAFVFAMLVVAIVLGISMFSRRSRASKVYVVVAGQVIATISAGIVASIRNYYAVHWPWGNKTLVIAEAQTAVFGSSPTLFTLIVLAVPIVAIMAFVLVNHRKLTLLTFSELETASMGVETGALRIGLLIATTALTAIIVSFVGPIGFVGFFMPHVTRKLVGPNFQYLIPATMLLAAAFTTGCYALSGFFSAGPTYTGMFISLIGAVAFLVVALQQRGNRHGDWL